MYNIKVFYIFTMIALQLTASDSVIQSRHWYLSVRIEKFLKAKKMTAFPKMTFYQNNVLTQLKIEMTLLFFKLD